MLLYFFMPAKGRNALILASSLFFYAWGEPVYIVIMILSTAIDYTAGRFIAKYDNDNKKRTVFLVISVVMNI